MSMTHMFEDVPAVPRGIVPRIVVEATEAGFGVRTEPPADSSARRIERIAATAGLVLVVLALVRLLPGAVSLFPGLGPWTLIVGAALLTGAVAVVGRSTRRLRLQTQFDLARRELHCVVRNGLGTVRLLRSVGFDEIADTFIETGTAADTPARLFLCVGAVDGYDLIEVARGPEDALDELRDRICRDLPQIIGT